MITISALGTSHTKGSQSNTKRKFFFKRELQTGIGSSAALNYFIRTKLPDMIFCYYLLTCPCYIIS